MMNISKELLSEVLEIDIVDYCIVENTVRINLLYHPDTALNRELELANTSYGSKGSINIYELAFRVRDYFKDRYNYELPMNGKVEEIFTKATQLHKSML